VLFGLHFWVSHALEMAINFYYPTLELFCFSFTQPFTHYERHKFISLGYLVLPSLNKAFTYLLTQNFVYPTLFSSVPPPAINNEIHKMKRMNIIFSL
jgi:hypothetical protein